MKILTSIPALLLSAGMATITPQQALAADGYFSLFLYDGDYLPYYGHPYGYDHGYGHRRHHGHGWKHHKRKHFGHGHGHDRGRGHGHWKHRHGYDHPHGDYPSYRDEHRNHDGHTRKRDPHRKHDNHRGDSSRNSRSSLSLGLGYTGDL